jgi:DMSO reductase family type II enzyme chaperone
MTNASPDRSGAAELAAARSRAYQLFAQAFGYPDDAFCDWVRGGGLSAPLRECLESIDAALASPGDRWETIEQTGEGDELAVEYTRLFDTGASGPPCPLYGGLYGGVRMKTMEEAVRFYNHFGLSLSEEEQRELPDHLTTELEFLHFLAYREAEALQEDGDPAPYQRAQRDFVARHPGAWVPELSKRLGGEDAHPFFQVLVGALGDLLEWDRTRLAAL